MRYLITGGAGFIGSHLVEAVAAGGGQVIVLDDLSTGRRENLRHVLGSGQVEFVEGSMLDEPVVDECMRSVDACFHLASAVGVQLVMSDPLHALLTNARGNDIVISSAVHHRRRLLFTSTSEIYGKRNDDALIEDSDRLLGAPSKSRWGYSTAKSLGESLAFAYHRQQKAETIVARLFNAAGPRQRGNYGMVLPRLVRQALNGDELTVYGDGRQSRCFTHVLDTVEALLMMMDSDASVGNAYNVGATAEIEILELATRVIERAQSSSSIQLVPYEQVYPDGFEELGRRKPDISALRRLTGWTPRRSVDEAIDDLIADELGEWTSAWAGATASG